MLKIAEVAAIGSTYIVVSAGASRQWFHYGDDVN
jgi:hypothetical protein